MTSTRRVLLGIVLVAFAFTGRGTGGQAPAPGAPAPAVVVSAAGPISWVRSFEIAKRTARQDQIIVVDVSTDWCTWCRFMDKHVYTEPSVREFAASHVFIRFDPKDGAEGQEFARKQHVKAYPSIFVFAPNGKLIAKQVGAFTGPDDFVGWLRGATARR